MKLLNANSQIHVLDRDYALTYYPTIAAQTSPWSLSHALQPLHPLWAERKMCFSSQVPEYQSPVQVLGHVHVPRQGIFRVPNTSVRAVDPA